MSALSPHARPLALLAGYICSLQAVAWLALSILGLIGHGDCKLWDSSSEFLTTVQQIYFQNRSCVENTMLVEPWLEKIMDPSAILAWMIIMVSVNSLWLLASLFFIVDWDRKKMQFTVPMTAMWCFVTAVVCVVDLVACAMFGADYGTILEFTSASKFLAPSAVIMTLSARGFVLWLFNFIILLYFVSALPTIQRQATAIKEAAKNPNPLDLYGPPAPGYDAFNQGYVMEHIDGNDTRTSATASLRTGYPIASGQHIPRPDYSPPLDPRRPNRPVPPLRSALKNNKY